MVTTRNLVIPLLCLALPAQAGKVSSRGRPQSKCIDVFFDVSATSQNVVFSSPPDPANPNADADFMAQIYRGQLPETNDTTPVTGTFVIRGTYCVPKKSATTPACTKRPALQVLVHGVTYNRSMWSGLGFPSTAEHEYNWHAYANARGYATLALDRLGHGDNPQRPDPLAVVQPQLHVEILHQILTAVRRSNGMGGYHSPGPSSHKRHHGTPWKTLGHTYDKVIFAGHSYGAGLGLVLATMHPADADAIILLGHSLASFARDPNSAPIKVVSAVYHDPARFGPHLPRGYITHALEADRTRAMYHAPGCDPAIPRADFKWQDTVTTGEMGAAPAVMAVGPAVAYTGAVLAVTGAQDTTFCEEPREKCEGYLRESGVWFPRASSYDYFVPADTGHSLTLHYSARRTFEKVHDWLDETLTLT